jgi:hypothetical protein
MDIKAINAKLDQAAQEIERRHQEAEEEKLREEQQREEQNALYLMLALDYLGILPDEPLTENRFEIRPDVIIQLVGAGHGSRLFVQEDGKPPTFTLRVYTSLVPNQDWVEYNSPPYRDLIKCSAREATTDKAKLLDHLARRVTEVDSFNQTVQEARKKSEVFRQQKEDRPPRFEPEFLYHPSIGGLRMECEILLNRGYEVNRIFTITQYGHDATDREDFFCILLIRDNEKARRPYNPDKYQEADERLLRTDLAQPGIDYLSGGDIEQSARDWIASISEDFDPDALSDLED